MWKHSIRYSYIWKYTSLHKRELRSYPEVSKHSLVQDILFPSCFVLCYNLPPWNRIRTVIEFHIHRVVFCFNHLSVNPKCSIHIILWSSFLLQILPLNNFVLKTISLRNINAYIQFLPPSSPSFLLMNTLILCFHGGKPCTQRFFGGGCLSGTLSRESIRWRWRTTWVVCHFPRFQMVKTRWWFHSFWNVHPENWGRWTHFDSYLSSGLKPPNRV